MNAPVKRMPDKSPWWVLISAVLSTRTRDNVTLEAVERLRVRAPDAHTLGRLSPAEVARVIYPVGFYRTKAKKLVKLAQKIEDEHQGQVPNSFEELVKLPAVGPKVANIVLAQGFGIPAIAVDTHVHRIANRLGLVRTKKPAETEKRLCEIVPVRFWREWNRLFVALGQTVCLPRKPLCQQCPLNSICLKRGTRAGKGQRGRRGGNFLHKLSSAEADAGAGR